MVEPAADSAKDPAPAPAFGPVVVQGSGGGLSSSLLTSLPQKTNSAPVTPLADLLRNVDLWKLYDTLKGFGYAEADDFQAATHDELVALGMTPMEAAKLRSVSTVTPIFHQLSGTQLTDYYTKLRGIGVAEAQDVIEVSDGELFSIGMSEMEVATLRSACEFDMVVPDYGLVAGASTNQGKKKKKKKKAARTKAEWIVHRQSLSSNPTSLLLLIALLPIWWFAVGAPYLDGYGPHRANWVAYVLLCYYIGGSTLWRCQSRRGGGRQKKPVGRYRVIKPVMVTGSFKLPSKGGRPAMYQLEEGDEVEAFQEKSHGGWTRLKLEEGWVTCVNHSGEANLLEIVTQAVSTSNTEDTDDPTSLEKPPESAMQVMPATDTEDDSLETPKKEKLADFMLHSSIDMLVIGIAALEYSWILCAACTLCWIIGTHVSPHSSGWAFDKATQNPAQGLITSRAVMTYSCALLALIFSWTGLGGVFAAVAVTLVHIDRIALWQEQQEQHHQLLQQGQSTGERPDAARTIWRRVLPPLFVAGFGLAQMETYAQFGGSVTDGAFGRLAWLCFSMWFSALYLDVHSSRWPLRMAGAGFDAKRLWSSRGARAYGSGTLAIVFNQWTETSLIGLMFAIGAVVTVHADCREQAAAAEAAGTLPRKRRLCSLRCLEVAEPSLAGRTLTVYALFVIATVRSSSCSGLCREARVESLNLMRPDGENSFETGYQRLGRAVEVVDSCSNGICAPCPADSVYSLPGVYNVTTARSSFVAVYGGGWPGRWDAVVCEEKISLSCQKGYKGSPGTFTRDAVGTGWSWRGDDGDGDGFCRRCEAGQYQPADDFTGIDCVPCPWPNVANAARTGCESCAAGQYATASWIRRRRYTCQFTDTDQHGSAGCQSYGHNLASCQSYVYFSSQVHVCDDPTPIWDPTCCTGSGYPVYELNTKVAPSCAICPEGQYQPEGGQSECVDCPEGRVSNAARTDCEACPAGKVRYVTGVSCEAECRGHGSASSGRCVCTDGYTGDSCEASSPTSPLPAGFAMAYTLSGCSDSTHCGVFRRVSADCTRGFYCPGGEYEASGGSDPSLCDGVPVYQKGDNHGPVLYRAYYDPYNDHDHNFDRWVVTSASNGLNYCKASLPESEQYLLSGQNHQPGGGPPDLAVYSEWTDGGASPVCRSGCGITITAGATDLCLGNPCGQHGSCTNSDTGACTCESDLYTGASCEVECSGHGSASSGRCVCANGYAGDRCQLGAPGFAESYTITGCGPYRDVYGQDTFCGVYRLASASCDYRYLGYTSDDCTPNDPTVCDGVPVYRKEGPPCTMDVHGRCSDSVRARLGGSLPEWREYWLYRHREHVWSDEHQRQIESTSWHVGRLYGNADYDRHTCWYSRDNALLLHSASIIGELGDDVAPTAPRYSAGEGWWGILCGYTCVDGAAGQQSPFCARCCDTASEDGSWPQSRQCQSRVDGSWIDRTDQCGCQYHISIVAGGGR